uniref:Uncharacterized protein n=1 Tax=Anguilla anguilla TaxID=7936 RepID=A0A0E9PJQ0_ANGAN
MACSHVRKSQKKTVIFDSCVYTEATERSTRKPTAQLCIKWNKNQC